MHFCFGCNFQVFWNVNPPARNLPREACYLTMAFVPPGTEHFSHSQTQDHCLHVWFEPSSQSPSPSKKGQLIILLSRRPALSPSRGPQAQLASTSPSLLGFKVGCYSTPWIYRLPPGSCSHPRPSMGREDMVEPHCRCIST